MPTQKRPPVRAGARVVLADYTGGDSNVIDLDQRRAGAPACPACGVASERAEAAGCSPFQCCVAADLLDWDDPWAVSEFRAAAADFWGRP
jgi:hypothetical protein